MLLTIDIGNTNITLGAYEGEKLQMLARMATDNRRTEDQYAVELRDILDINGVQAAAIDGAIISSVVPHVGAVMRQAAAKLCGVAPLVLGPGVKTGLNIKIDNPAQLGADLAAGAVAALAICPPPCIIVDLGTATTISVLDKEGAFLGGAIAAGIGITLDALSSRTAQLPAIHIEAPKKVIGSNTVDCMKSGLVLGAAAMVDGMIDRIDEELGEEASVIATGGLAREVVAVCRRQIRLEENLLLEGLRLIYEKNKK